MGGLIRIDIPKGVEEGSTSVAPKSPIGASTASPSISRKGAVMLGYSAMVAKTVYSNVVQEIRAGGNEELATGIENGVTALGIGVSAYTTGGLSLIPLAIGAASKSITMQKNLSRQNRAREYERSMLGSRVNYTQGGGYE